MDNKVMKREEISNEFKWRMEDVYSDENLWREDIEKVEKLLPGLTKMQGKICENKDNFKHTIELINEIEFLVERYISMLTRNIMRILVMADINHFRMNRLLC